MRRHTQQLKPGELIVATGRENFYRVAPSIGRTGVNGGEGGIRTPDTLTSMPDFESGAFNRALPPLRVIKSHAVNEMSGQMLRLCRL